MSMEQRQLNIHDAGAFGIFIFHPTVSLLLTKSPVLWYSFVILLTQKCETSRMDKKICIHRGTFPLLVSYKVYLALLANLLAVVAVYCLFYSSLCVVSVYFSLPHTLR